MGSNSASSLQNILNFLFCAKHESHGYVQQNYAKHKTMSPMKLEEGKYNIQPITPKKTSFLYFKLCTLQRLLKAYKQLTLLASICFQLLL